MDEKAGEIDEEGLLRRVQFSDAGAAATAYETLVRHFNPRLLRYLAGKGLTSEERQDIAAETWLRAWRLIAAYQYRGIGLFPWLRRIADHVRQELFRHRYLGISLEETPEVLETLAAPEDAAADALAGAAAITASLRLRISMRLELALVVARATMELERFDQPATYDLLQRARQAVGGRFANLLRELTTGVRLAAALAGHGATGDRVYLTRRLADWPQ